MAPPLYFFAKKMLSDVFDDRWKFRPALLAEHGLAEVFSDIASRDQTATNELTKQGPGGFSGVICTLLPVSGQVPIRTGYHPEFQTWHKAGPDLFIGVDNEHPPCADDLLRANATREGGELRGCHRGYRYQLADGGWWDVPVIRRPPAAATLVPGLALTRLPQDIGWDEEGRFCETIKPAYRQLWEDTAAICDQIFEPDGSLRDGEFEITIEQGLKWCLRILQLNYRYGRHEHRLLRAIDQTNVWQVLGMAVDAPLVTRLIAKKNARSTREAVNTSPGHEAAATDTSPAAAS